MFSCFFVFFVFLSFLCFYLGLFLSFVLGFVCLLFSFFCVVLLFVFVFCIGFCLSVCFLFLFSLATLCSLWALGSPPGVGARHPGWECQVQDAGPPENSKAQEILIGVCSPGDIHLDTKTQLRPTACRLQCWTPHTKQPAGQEYNLIHQWTGCQKLY